MRQFVWMILLFVPVLATAQPKMHLLAFGGITGNRFIYRDKSVTSEFFPGWEAGIGGRLRKKQFFGELDFSYTRYGAEFPLEVESDTLIVDSYFSAYEIPLAAGFVPVVSPLVKWYLYTGPVNRINLGERVRIDVLGVEEKFKPSDLGFPVYHLMWRFGTQVDLAMLNFNLSWTIGVTNALRQTIRTNHEVLRLTGGLRF